jgi:hypothetical protein
VYRVIGVKNQLAIELSLTRGVIGFIAVTGAEPRVCDPKNDQRYEVSTVLRSIELTALIGMPIRNERGEIIGAMIALNKHGMPAFTDDDFELLRAFGQLSAIAFDRKPPEPDPDRITAGNIALREMMVAEVASFSFSAFDISENNQMRVLAHFLSSLGISSEFAIQPATLLNFLRTACGAYNHVPFRNWSRAVDMAQFVFYEIQTGKLTTVFTKLEMFAVLVASICHAVGYLSPTLTPARHTALSVLYRGQPPAETAFCRRAVQIMGGANCNIIEGLDVQHQRAFWETVVGCIMVLNPKQRAEFVHESTHKLRMQALDLTKPSSRVALLKLIIITADFARLIRPFSATDGWAKIFGEEVLGSSSGGNVLNESIPVPQLVRQQADFAAVQTKPVLTLLEIAVPALAQVKAQFDSNSKKWSQLAEVQ